MTRKPSGNDLSPLLFFNGWLVKPQIQRVGANSLRFNKNALEKYFYNYPDNFIQFSVFLVSAGVMEIVS